MKFWMLNNVLLFSNELEKLESVYGTRHRKFGKVKLVDVRSRLKHGQFETWLAVWLEPTYGYNFINV